MIVRVEKTENNNFFNIFHVLNLSSKEIIFKFKKQTKVSMTSVC